VLGGGRGERGCVTDGIRGGGLREGIFSWVLGMVGGLRRASVASTGSGGVAFKKFFQKKLFLRRVGRTVSVRDVMRVPNKEKVA